MQHKNKQKPTKDSFIKFYIVWPIQNRLKDVTNFFKWVWRKITGAWWCDHCNKCHGRRVHKFQLHSNLELGYGISAYKPCVCSLGMHRRWTIDSSPLKDIQSAKAKIDTAVVNVKRLSENLQQVADDIAKARGDELQQYKDLAN